jgi:hypothetical protein
MVLWLAGTIFESMRGKRRGTWMKINYLNISKL